MSWILKLGKVKNKLFVNQACFTEKNIIIDEIWSSLVLLEVFHKISSRGLYKKIKG